MITEKIMPEKLDLLGLTNALTDIVVDVREEDLAELGIPKSFGSLKNTDPEKFSRFMETKIKEYQPAGSPANTIFNAAALGLSTGLMGMVGSDEAGDFYLEELDRREIFPILNQVDGKSGVCYVLLTPDGERTVVAQVNVSNIFDFELPKLPQARAFHSSGYELRSDPEKLLEIAKYMKNAGSTISFDLAAPKMVKSTRESLEKLLSRVDILFMTEEEAQELTGLSPDEALENLRGRFTATILKKGKKGAVVADKNNKYDIPTIPVNVVSTCGAGDAYAAGFLFGYLQGYPIKQCGEKGSCVASRVCGMREAHL